MKARVTTKIPERVLSFQLEEALQQRLSMVLQQLGIQEYQVTPEELSQQVGYLAGFPGFGKRADAPAASPVCGGVLCMCGISSARMNTLLKALREHEIEIPLKAAVTATNQHWSFARLIEELSKEYEAFQRQKR